MARTNNLHNFLTDVVQVVKNQKDDQTPIKVGDLDTEINNFNVTWVEPTDHVRFLDYDGSVLFSYTQDEFLALEEMPTPPNLHEDERIVPYDWNWTLADAKDTVQYHKFLDIGLLYNTDTGYSFIHVSIPSDNTTIGIARNSEPLSNQYNWGDNDTTYVYDNMVLYHTYEHAGNYMIEINSWSYERSNTPYNIVKGKEYVTRIDAGEVGIADYSYLPNLKYVTFKIFASSSYCKFRNCFNLIHITMPSNRRENNGTFNSYMFSNCYNLKSISLSKNFHELPSNVFENCYNLKRLLFGKTAGDTIGNYLFTKCYSFEIVRFLTNKGVVNLNACINLKSFRMYECTGFTNSYSSNKNIVDFEATGTYTTMPANAFQYCINLKHVKLGNSLTAINQYAFDGCSSLKEIEIPDSVTTINQYAFQNCYNLKNISFPTSLTTINQYAFQNCVSLTNIELPENEITFGMLAFAYTNIKDLTIKNIGGTITDIFSSMVKLETLTIENTTTTSWVGLASGCPALKEVNLPNNITIFSGAILNSCPSLTHLTLPSSLTTINGTIAVNSPISELAFPSSLSSMVGTAISSYVNIADFTQATQIPTLTSALSTLNANAIIKVPSTLYDTWITSQYWVDKASQIVSVEVNNE